MKNVIRAMAAVAGLLIAPVAVAQAPANASGLCKDGTYTTAASKSGACHGHKGVKTWLAAETPAPAKSTATKASAAAPAAAPAPATAPAKAEKPSAARTSSGPSSKTANLTQAAGGGPGLVWVNASSNVYHCYGSSYYGKTREGSYMPEAQAKAKGAHPDHGKACSK